MGQFQCHERICEHGHLPCYDVLAFLPVTKSNNRLFHHTIHRVAVFHLHDTLSAFQYLPIRTLATIPVGDGIQGVGDDVAFSVAGNATAVVVVDSGAYKHVSGDNKGKLVGKTTAELKVSAVELP